MEGKHDAAGDAGGGGGSKRRPGTSPPSALPSSSSSSSTRGTVGGGGEGNWVNSVAPLPATPGGGVAGGPPPEARAEAPTPKNPAKQAEFQQLFNLPLEEVVEDYTCAYQGDAILYHGRMYMTYNCVCFHSQIFKKTLKIIEFAEITDISKKNTAIVFPNAIEFSTVKRKFTFASFMYRDHAFKLATELWKARRGGSLRITDRERSFDNLDKRLSGSPSDSSHLESVHDGELHMNGEGVVGDDGDGVLADAGNAVSAAAGYIWRNTAPALQSAMSLVYDGNDPALEGGEKHPLDEDAQHPDVNNNRKEESRPIARSPLPLADDMQTQTTNNDKGKAKTESSEPVQQGNVEVPKTEVVKQRAQAPENTASNNVQSDVRGSQPLSASSQPAQQPQLPATQQLAASAPSSVNSSPAPVLKAAPSTPSVAPAKSAEAARRKAALAPLGQACPHICETRKESIVLDIKLEMNVLAFYYNFIADERSDAFWLGINQELGYTDNKIGLWKVAPERCCSVRPVSFVVPLTHPLGPKCTKAAQTQRVRFKTKEHMVFFYSTVSCDVPYSDTFTTDAMWDVTTVSSNPPIIRLVVSGWVQFSKSPWLKSVIQKNAEEGINTFYPVFERHVIAATALYKKKQAELRAARVIADAGPASAANPEALVAATPQSAAITGQVSQTSEVKVKAESEDEGESEFAAVSAEKEPASEAVEEPVTAKPFVSSVTRPSSPPSEGLLGTVTGLVSAIPRKDILLGVLLCLLLLFPIWGLFGRMSAVETELQILRDSNTQLEQRVAFLQTLVGVLNQNITGTSSDDLWEQWTDWRATGPGALWEQLDKRWWQVEPNSRPSFLQMFDALRTTIRRLEDKLPANPKSSAGKNSLES